MAIFDYECNKCDLIEEHYVRKAEDVVICPKCATEMMKLFTSRFTFVLKGDGFYKQGRS